MVSIDLEKCFNALDRDALMEACLSCPLTAPLAHYVATTYPGGMQVLLNVLGDWRRIPFERGIAQGRPLSPVLASILLLGVQKKAWKAMCEHMRLDPDSAEARERLSLGGYLDDCGILAPPEVARVGYLAFRQACLDVGCNVNEKKTVNLVGVGYYLPWQGRTTFQQAQATT